MKKQLFPYICLILVTIFPFNAFAYMDKTTHPEITENAVKNSLIAKTSYLEKNLGLSPTDPNLPHITIELFADGEKKSIEDWLKSGSKEEDAPLCRPSNHFHDPLQEWIDARVDDIPWPLTSICSELDDGFYGPDTIVSNVTWSTGYKSRPVNDLESYQDEVTMGRNEWDWDSARQYYHKFLCGYAYDSESNIVRLNQEQREAYLAKTFRAIGQVLHLLEDTAVPAHVRNDFFIGHLEGIIPEGWQIPLGNQYEAYVSYQNDADWFDSTEINSFSLEPNMLLTDFWDMDKYKGITTYEPSERLGLSEFTNMNFVSAGSSFASNSAQNEYPFPNEESTNYLVYLNKTLEPEIVIGKFGIEKKVHYLSKVKDEVLINRFVVPSYFLNSVYDSEGSLRYDFKRRYHMDDNCFSEQAAILIPRAIGYARDLIDYFFRGKINLVPDTETGYGYVIENNSDETMTGLFELFYDQKVENSDIVRRVPVLTSFGAPFVHWKSIPANNKSDNVLSFNMPEDAATPGEYILVFNGKLGKEKNAIVGKVLTLEESKRFLDITLPSDGYYARTDKHPYYQDTQDPRYTNNPGTKGFDKIIVNVKNIAPDHVEMTGGTVKLAVIYRLGSGDQFKNPQADTSFGFYILNKEITVAGGISRDTPKRLEFDLTGTELPLWATDIYLNLTYDGILSLGSEYLGDLGAKGEDIETVCSGFKDIAEPTPIDMLNLMDVICINDGNGPLLYDAGSNAALEIVDTDDDGDADEWDIYVHDIRDMTLEFSYTCSEPECKYSIPYLAAGDYQRLFVLSDYEGEKNVYGGDYFTLAVDPADTRYHNNYYFQFVNRYHGVKNQSEFGEFPECDGSTYCWKRTITSFYGPIRGLYVLKALIKVNDGYPGDADPLTELTCSYRDQ